MSMHRHNNFHHPSPLDRPMSIICLPQIMGRTSNILIGGVVALFLGVASGDSYSYSFGKP